MSVQQLFTLITNFLAQIYRLGDTPIFGQVTINDFWFGFAIMAVLITTLIVFGRSAPITPFSGFDIHSGIKPSKLNDAEKAFQDKVQDEITYQNYARNYKAQKRYFNELISRPSNIWKSRRK